MFPRLIMLTWAGFLAESTWILESKLFNISHFSSTVWPDTMAKRSQQDSGEERVTAKSRPMMNLIARTPSFVSSSTSVSPGKRHYGSQDPWRSIAREDRSGRPDKSTDLFEASDHCYHEQIMQSFSSTDYSKLDYDRVWSSQEWKAEATTYDRSGRPDKINSQNVARLQNFVMGNDETELELSVESRSFVNRVNDQVRKRQKRISNVAGDGEEHSMIWGMFMAVTMESAVFMGKIFQNNRNSIVNTADLTLMHMFDISCEISDRTI